MDFLRVRLQNNLGIVDRRLARYPFLVGERPTIADVSLAGYLFYPAEEFGFDIADGRPAIAAWRERVRALPGWGHPYDLMPGHPMAA
jgi:glutathione S-transferase